LISGIWRIRSCDISTYSEICELWFWLKIMLLLFRRLLLALSYLNSLWWSTHLDLKDHSLPALSNFQSIGTDTLCLGNAFASHCGIDWMETSWWEWDEEDSLTDEE
jgi:hypothetical protein